MARKRTVLDMAAPKRSSGMTLIEVLMAIIVVGAAISVFIAFFAAGALVGDDSRSRSVGSAFAEEQMLAITQNPSAYDWSQLKSMPTGELAEVKARTQEPASAPSLRPPSTMPLLPRAYDREHNFYERFTWQAFARVPDRDAGYVELTVVVRWPIKNHVSMFALTSAMPRAALETTT